MDDVALLEALREGDEQAFATLVRRYHASMVRVARYYVRSEASAEDVVQDTWIVVIRGLERFEGRSSFKTWLFHILANRARTTGQRDGRSISVDLSDEENGLAANRFDAGGAWSEPPVPFTERVDDAIVNEPILVVVRAAIAALPEPHQSVVTLRDVEGLSTAEVAEILKISEANVRVILHRARSRIRATVESQLQGGVR